MFRRLAALLLAVMLLPLPALADIVWPDQTAGQQQLRDYVGRVNGKVCVSAEFSFALVKS